MELIRHAWCLFEQSGTFRDAFRSFGIDSSCIDMCDEFGTTDLVVDIFDHIHDAFVGLPSIFDAMTSDDLVFAFFPCTYFSTMNRMYFNGTHINLPSDPVERNKVIIDRSRSRQYYYETLLQLFTVAESRGLRLVVENPYHDSYLRNNLPYQTVYIDTDRSLMGDCLKKPTCYWFVNCEPSLMIPPFHTDRAVNGIVHMTSGIGRSIISPVYARNFIEYVLVPDNITI